MNEKGFEGDPLEVLRGVDPLDPVEVPNDTTGAHARALFQEVTSMDTKQGDKATSRPMPRRSLVFSISGAALLALVIGAFTLFGGNDPSQDPVITGGEPIAGAAMCAEFYDLDTLAARDIAFDGTLDSSSGDEVTFTVNNWYKGGTEDEITLQAIGLTPGSVSSLGAGLELGQRYLVSGSDGNVWACGFTMTYDTAIANEWASVFSG